MERGELAVGASTPTTVFVFEDLVAHLKHPKWEKAALKVHGWASALDAWEMDFQVCAYMRHMTWNYGVPIRVITWRPQGFADMVGIHLTELDVPMSAPVRSEVYSDLSPRLAVDTDVNTVFDPDPAHRYSYGFKTREFDLGAR